MRWCVARPGRAALAKRGNPASVHGYARPSEPVALRTGGFCGQFHFSGKPVNQDSAVALGQANGS